MDSEQTGKKVNNCYQLKFENILRKLKYFEESKV